MSYTLTQTGQVLTETQDGVTMPADYGFATVNDYVHSIERTYEDLECLCLGMACHIDQIGAERQAFESAAEYFKNQTSDLASKGQRIAMLLEAICISADFDNVATSKYWNEAMQAIEEWRQ